jgi:ribosomal-protein-alanine N-acetyltransferase
MDFEVENFDQTKQWLTEAIGHNEAVPRFSHHSAIVLRDSGQIAGWIAVGHPENEANSIADRAFGYALGQKFWGQGIMPEAVRGMLRFCFEVWDVQSVSAQCSKQNELSSKCLLKAGMKLVREFLSPQPKDGVSLLYLARAEDWMPIYRQSAWRNEG